MLSQLVLVRLLLTDPSTLGNRVDLQDHVTNTSS